MYPINSLLGTDYETDTVIQSSLRQQLGKDVTLMTVAHRLQTIMDADKIVSAQHLDMRLVLMGVTS